MPSDADQVLKIVPSTGEVTRVGPILKGINKWQGAVRGPDGKIYGIPSDARHVLQINPDTDEVSLIGNLPRTFDKWQGGFLARDNIIYCIPENATEILRIIAPGQQVVAEENLGRWLALGIIAAVTGIMYRRCKCQSNS